MSINEETTVKEEDDTIWPPPPSLSSPSLQPQEPWLARLPIEMVILMDIGIGLFFSGSEYLHLWSVDKPISRHDVVAGGVVPGLSFFGMHIWLRFKLNKDKSRLKLGSEQGNSASPR